jgi:predicted PurR-regulated permease PerM
MVMSLLVMCPAGIILIFTGDAWQGVAIILIAAIPIDNILMPKLVGRDTGMHELLVFISTLGDLSVFGIMGFLIGPIIAAMFVTILHVYSVGFRQHLEPHPSVISDPNDTDTSQTPR